ncbi:MAG: hypothetical protein AAF609_15010 [Cyanobacteria bacterium P01_C01_bin.120]
MVERTLTLRFIGRDAGLIGVSGRGADSVARLGGAAVQANQQLERLGRGGGFASFTRSIEAADDRAAALRGRLGALTQANVDLAAGLRIPVSSVQELNRSLGTLPDRTAIIASEYLKLQRSGTDAAESQRILGRTIGLSERQFQSLEQTLGPTIERLEEVQDLSGFEDLAIGGTALAGTLSLLGGISFNNFSQFEQFEAALSNAFQDGDRASDELQRISEFASETPFQVDTLTQSFISLVNRGFIPTNQELTNLGDIAASQSKEFDQLAEALLDAETGEFERLKEFGILARSAGDEVTFSFRGVEQTVARTPEAIRAALISFGELEGVAGSLAAQSQTTAGAVSNLQDSLQQASVVAGGVVATGINSLIDAASALVNGFLALPAPLQASLVGLTGFTAALSGAIALIATFEALQIRSRIALAAQTAATIANATAKNAALAIETAYGVAQTVSNTAITRSNAALVANTVATRAAAAAKQLYALATGQAATASTVLITRLAVIAAQAALVVGAIAAVAQVFQRSEGAEFAADLREAVVELENTRDAAESAGMEIQQGFLDVLRDRGPIEALQVALADLDAALGGTSDSASRFGERWGVITRSQLGAQRAQIALANATDRLGGSVASTNDLLRNFGIVGNDIQLPADQVTEFTNAAAEQVKILSQEIELFETQKGQSEELDQQLQNEINIRENLIQTIQDKVAAQGGDVEAVGAAAAATKELSDVLDELSQKYDDLAQSIDTSVSEDLADVAQQQANGFISEAEAETRRFNIEQQQLRRQIGNSRAELAELRAQRNERSDSSEDAAQIDREILKLRQEIADDEIQLASEAIDRQEDLTDAETKAAEDRKKAIAEAEADRLEAIQDAADDALAVVTESAQRREIELARLRRDGILSEEQYQEQLAAAGTDRITAELEAEKEKLAELEAADGDFVDQIRESRQQVNALTLSLIESEIEAEERAAEAAQQAAENARDAAIAAAEERLQAQQNAIEAEVQAISRLETALDAVNASYERQDQLLSARASLGDTLASAQQSAFDIAAQLADTEDERRQRERDADRARLAVLDRAQALELRTFDLRQRQLQIENQIEQARVRGAIAENRAAQAAAQANIETLRAEGASDAQINAAQLSLQATRDQGEALAQQFAATLAQSDILRESAAVGRADLLAQQGDERLQTRFENLQNAQARADETGSRSEQRLIERLGSRLEQDAIRASNSLGGAISSNFDQALGGLNDFADRIEATSLVGTNPNAALNPFATLPSLANQSITPVTPLPATGVSPQLAQQLLNIQQGAAGGITQVNNITQNFAAGVDAETVGADIEAVTFNALNRVVTRARQMRQ